MQTTETKPDGFWSLIIYGIAAITALVAITTIVAGVFNPLVWAIVLTPIAALIYAARRSD